MNTKVLVAALAGAVVTFLSGWLLYGMLLKGFYDSNTMEAARSIMRSDADMIIWAIFAGSLCWSLLLALVYSRWANINTLAGGATAGAWIGLLIGLGADFFNYGSANIMTLNAVIVDGLVNGLQGALSGAVVGFVLGYGAKK